MIADGGATRWNLEQLDRRLKWPCEHANRHAEFLRTAHEKFFIYAGLPNYALVGLVRLYFVNGPRKIYKWLSTSKLRISES